MSHRAIFIVISMGGCRTYASDWGALNLPAFVFWGAETTLSNISRLQQIEHDKLAEELQGERGDECQGGMLLDLDRRVLLFFGGDEIAYERPLQAMFVKMLKAAWSGWKIRWAYEGSADLAKYLGIDDDSESLIDDYELPPRLLFVDEHDAADCWVTLRTENGAFIDAMIDTMSHGPAALSVRHLPALRTMKPCPIPAETEPTCGAFIDEQEREITFWDSAPVSGIEASVKKHFEGWRVDRQHLGWSLQLEMSHRTAQSAVAANPRRLASRIVEIVTESTTHENLAANRLLLAFQDVTTHQKQQREFAALQSSLSDSEQKQILQGVLSTILL